MGGHHKKNLRAEKAKVKLKGVKLEKGLNITKTDFKIRKITIREQLKESQYIEGQRQINLKEILTRLKHHSSTFRSEALRNLREAILAGHGGVLAQLGTIIQGVAAISLDAEKDARRECFKTLGKLLAALDEEAVTPFFHMLSTYLRCAMTHIQPAIQDDALIMMDVLLEHVPNLVASHSDKIFQNFLEMISRVRAEGDRAGRTLTVHMGQNQTTIKWRSKILLRLQHMLQTLAANRKANATSCNSIAACRTITFNVRAPQYFNVLRTYKSNVPDLEEIFNRSVGTTNVVLDDTSIDRSKLLRSYIDHLMPLLFDAWLEVRPQEAHGNSQILLTEDAALTLQIVLEIIQNLWVLVDQHEQEVNNNDLSSWYCSKYSELFANNFLYAAFPYQKNEEVSKTTTKKSKKPQLIKSNPYCPEQNIILSYLLCRFVANTAKKHTAHFTVLLHYLMTIVNNLKKVQNEQQNEQEHLVTALRAYLLNNGLQLLKYQVDDMRSLLCSTINAFLENQFAHRDGISAGILILLCQIVQSTPLFNAYGSAEFTNFLEYLPQLLLKTTITENALLAMSNLAKQKNTVFLKALEPLLSAVIANLVRIQVVGASTAFEGKKHIMNLFYWTDRQWDASALIQKIDEHITDKRILSYFKFIITN